MMTQSEENLCTASVQGGAASSALRPLLHWILACSSIAPVLSEAARRLTAAAAAPPVQQASLRRSMEEAQRGCCHSGQQRVV